MKPSEVKTHADLDKLPRWNKTLNGVRIEVLPGTVAFVRRSTGDTFAMRRDQLCSLAQWYFADQPERKVKKW